MNKKNTKNQNERLKMCTGNLGTKKTGCLIYI